MSGCSKSKNANLKKVRLNEVTRSVFYAPMYVAINKGFFKKQGINIELSTGSGADKTMQQVISKSADVGFCGPEQTIYIYNQKREDNPVLFAQLTQRDGAFLVGRNKENFKWENLKGKTVIGGRPGGVPEMALEYVLRNHGLTPGNNVKIITNLALTATAGAFKSGTGDYVTLFEPSGTILEKDNSGAIVASVGQAAGVIPYTCYFATKSYIQNNKDTILRFTKAIYEGQLWVQKNSNREIANTIKSFFPGTDASLLAASVENYRKINAYAKTPVLKENDLNRLMDIIQSYKADLIKERPEFNKIVNTSFANKAIETVK
nr:ABC transporter substrate-binding protein [Clostridium oryzae]